MLCYPSKKSKRTKSDHLTQVMKKETFFYKMHMQGKIYKNPRMKLKYTRYQSLEIKSEWSRETRPPSCGTALENLSNTLARDMRKPSKSTANESSYWRKSRSHQNRKMQDIRGLVNYVNNDIHPSTSLTH